MKIDDDEGNAFTDPRYFTYHTYYTSYRMDTELKQWVSYQNETGEIDQELCNTKHINSQTLDKQRLHDYHCSNLNNISLGGNWNTDRVYSIKGYVKRCDSVTEKKYNITCATKSELRFSKSGSLYLTSIIFKNLLDSKNLTDPVDRYYSYSSLPLHFDVFNFTLKDVMTEYITYSISDIITDAGIIFKDHDLTSFIEFEEYHNVPGMDDGVLGNIGQVAEMSFILSRRRQIYNRSYIKIQDVVANVGGFMGLIYSLFEYLITFYIDNSYTVFLCNKFYRLQVDNDEDENKQLDINRGNSNQVNFNMHNNNSGSKLNNINGPNSPTNIIDIRDLSMTPIIINENREMNDKTKDSIAKINKVSIKQKETQLNKELDKILEFKKKPRKEIQVNKWERYTWHCCCFESVCFQKSKKDILKYNVMMAAEDKLNKKLEIIELLKVVEQFKLFGKIYLNENQHFMLLNRDKQDIITKEKIKDKIDIHLIEDKEKEKKEHLLEYLIEKKQQSKINTIDKVLYTYLDRDIKRVVEEKINMDV